MGLLPSKTFFSKSSHDKKEEPKIFKRRSYGRAPDKDPFLSRYSYVHWKVCKEYLKCDIKPWKRNSEHARITLDSLPTDFFDRDYPGGLRPVKQQHFKMDGELYRRVVGFREILVKREYAEYLEDLRKPSGFGKIKGYPVYHPYWKLARGGGPKVAATRSVLKKHGDGTVKKEGTDEKEKPAAAKKNPVKKTVKKNAGPGFFGRICGGQPKKKVPLHADEILKHQAVKKWKWPNKRKRLPQPKSNPPGKYIVLLHRLYRMPKENQERDNEWLYLSSSTEENDPNVVTHFEKDLRTWMTPGISFESQKLFRQLALLWTLNTLSGRSFLSHRNNFYRGHVEFSGKKRNMLIFFLTSILLWTTLCISFCSYVDINTQLTLHQTGDLFLEVEKIEMHKYWLPYAVIIGNLILVSFWSLAVILGDGAMVAHYLNCWCAALHEMETSGCTDIRKVTCRNLQIFTLLVIAYAVMFVFDWPAQVRGSCMVTSMLLLRPSIPLMRINQPGKVLFYQWIGFGIQLYILFCARLVMCTLQVFALLVKNVSEMWNFKFSLRFQLLTKENRGELFQLALNHSLAKLWSHHRLIVLLLEQYGLVFCVGIMCYLIPQVCIFAVALATLILTDAVGEKDFYGEETHIKIYSDYAPTILIPYYHSKLEDLFLALFIFLHICVDFFFTTETLVSATDAFMTGAEFVRRAGMMTAKKSHERRLIYSLQWSFSPSRLHALTANRYFTLDRHSLTKLFSFIILVFTIIVRLYKHSPPIKVDFPLPGSCDGTLGQTLIHGICSITGDPRTTPIPPPPPADYYFFMEDCNKIEKNFTGKVQSFEYYSENKSGIVKIADKPPFQICRVKIPDGTRLPDELEDLGRYFQDHGNVRLKKTLEIYLNQTYDVSQLSYLTIRAATSGFHSDSTGGNYCGPDPRGQPGKLCEWVEYYRDCVVACYSKLLNRTLLVPRMWRKDATGYFTLYSDYSIVDCGLNPFGFQFKGDAWSIEEPAFDCFGNPVIVPKFDQCSNIPWKEPVATFTPVKGDAKMLQRGYSSSWNTASKDVVPASAPGGPSSPPPCDDCYNSTIGMDRCNSTTLTKNHCAYARYWGPPGPSKGYYYADHCFNLNIDLLDIPKANGFCRWHYVEGGLKAGHVVSEAEYNDARITQWNKEWNMAKGGDIPPCKQANFTPGALRPIKEQLYFKHVCLSNQIPKPGSCSDPFPNPYYFSTYRPYERVGTGCQKLRQIKLDYETTPQGNSEICNYQDGTLKVPEYIPFNLTVQGTRKTYLAFYGCHGKLLLPTNKGRKYTCISPEIKGVCEVDAEHGFFLYGDCTDPDVVASKSALLRSLTQAHQSWTLNYGICSALIDYGDPVFKDYRLKLLSEDLVFMLSRTTTWTTTNKWTTAFRILSKHPGAPTLPNSKTYCDLQLTTSYCGNNSVPLHYPFDGRESIRANDKFLCNWEVYTRDCLQPFQSKISGGWVYLPLSGDRTLKLNAAQRKSDPLLNTFWVGKDVVGCDGRKLPAAGQEVDNYWKDECGWRMTPEFMDGDLKSLAVMPPILPFARQAYSDDGQQIVERVLNCFESEYAIYRCTHPDISPICKNTLSIWEPKMGEIHFCYRFNASCFQYFGKQPNGSSTAPTYPQGFCSGYCPMGDVKDYGPRQAIDEPHMEVWRRVENISFDYPPCKKFINSSFLLRASTQLFVDAKKPRDIEHHLFFQFHCSDPTKNGALRDPLGPSSGSFHWPMYRTEDTLMYQLLPLQQLRDHLTTNFGPSCDYGGRQNEDKIYPPFVTVTDTSGQKRQVNRSEFLGCHGKPLIWFMEEFRQNTAEMAVVGITDPLRDYKKACNGPLLGGWCEAVVEPFVFLRDDFEVSCKGPNGTNRCSKNCSLFQGHFLMHPLATQIEDIPGYHPFVKSKKKFVQSVINDTNSSINSTRIDLPYRRTFLHEFKDTIVHWRTYLEPRYQARHIRESKALKYEYCYQRKIGASVTCAWPWYLRYCYIPCNLVWPKKVVTQVSQSLVERTPGQSNMYLRPLAYFFNITSGYTVPRFSHADCIIDPYTSIRNLSKREHEMFSCSGKLYNNSRKIDIFQWVPMEEYLPDFAKKIRDPATGFDWIPWRISQPVKERFDYIEITNFSNPTITYAANPPTLPASYNIYASPYLNCHRISQEYMRRHIVTAIGVYWNPIIYSSPLMTFPINSYNYDPESGINDANNRKCVETPVWVYIDFEACQMWNLRTRVLRIYGFCKIIFPAWSAHTAYAALEVSVSPPEGCFTNTTSNYAAFDKIWKTTGNSGYRGFGIKYSMQDVYQMWNSLCHSCAYTREMHQQNLHQVWCGHRQDANPGCMSRVETNNAHRQPIILGDGIFYKNTSWTKSIQQIGVLWRLATQYTCWNPTGKYWARHARWRTYHPWSLKHEGNKQQAAAYTIHVPLNALNCPYPCKSQDESEDCNSKCPLDLHNPCGRKLDDFFNYNSPTVGLNYTVTLQENGNLCQVPLPGLNDKVQGLGIFGEYGINIVRTSTKNSSIRTGQGIYTASSETILLDDPRGTGGGKVNAHGISFCAIVSATQCRPTQDVIPNNLRTRLYEAPRFAAVHPGYFTSGSDTSPMYSSYCAGFEGDKCEVTSVAWDTSKPVPNSYTTFAKWAASSKYVNPFAYLKIQFSSECTVKDRELVTDLLDSNTNSGALYSDPPPKGYCCVPYQTTRKSPNTLGADGKVWEKRYFLTVRNTWTKCEDYVDSSGNSHFGWLFRWNKWARYLSACPYNDCKTNGFQCLYKLKNYVSTGSTNLCQRQFDPQETFLVKPLPRCLLPLPPF